MNLDEFDGRMFREGVDIFAIPLWRVCNVILSCLLENRDTTDREKFLSRLERPPKGVRAETGVWAVSSQAAAFDQSMSALNEFESTHEPAD